MKKLKYVAPVIETSLLIKDVIMASGGIGSITILGDYDLSNWG